MLLVVFALGVGLLASAFLLTSLWHARESTTGWRVSRRQFLLGEGALVAAASLGTTFLLMDNKFAIQIETALVLTFLGLLIRGLASKGTNSSDPRDEPI
jgi:hypothetical protein